VRCKRRRLWIDRFQTLLYIRIVIFCALYQLSVWLVCAVWQKFDRMSEATIGQRLASWVPLLLVFLTLAPIVSLDALRFSHRLIGPLVRFRKTFRAIAEGQPVELVRLRKGDFLEDMKDELNEMLQTLEQRGLVMVERTERSGRQLTVAS
jgi:hypothetical protein